MSNYCTPQDILLYSLNEATYSQMRQASIMPMITSASAIADGFLTSQYQLPLITWTPELNMMVAHIAAFFLFIQRGFNPDAPEDKLIKARYDLAMRFLKQVNDQEIHPMFVDSPPTSESSAMFDANGPFLITESPRGFTPRGYLENANTVAGSYPGDITSRDPFIP